MLRCSLFFGLRDAHQIWNGEAGPLEHLAVIYLGRLVAFETIRTPVTYMFVNSDGVLFQTQGANIHKLGRGYKLLQIYLPEGRPRRSQSELSEHFACHLAADGCRLASSSSRRKARALQRRAFNRLIYCDNAQRNAVAL